MKLEAAGSFVNVKFVKQISEKMFIGEVLDVSTEVKFQGISKGDHIIYQLKDVVLTVENNNFIHHSKVICKIIKEQDKLVVNEKNNFNGFVNI
jgi:hypothetical protein